MHTLHKKLLSDNIQNINIKKKKKKKKGTTWINPIWKNKFHFV